MYEEVLFVAMYVCMCMHIMYVLLLFFYSYAAQSKEIQSFLSRFQLSESEVDILSLYMYVCMYSICMYVYRWTFSTTLTWST